MDWYQKCNMDTVNVEMGKRLTTISGAVHMLINAFCRYVYLVLTNSWQQSIITAIDQANMSGSIEDWEAVGYPIGQLY